MKFKTPKELESTIAARLEDEALSFTSAISAAMDETKSTTIVVYFDGRLGLDVFRFVSNQLALDGWQIKKNPSGSPDVSDSYTITPTPRSSDWGDR